MSHAAAVWFCVHDDIESDRSTTGNILDYFDDEFIFRTLHLSRFAVSFIIDCVRTRLERFAERSLPVDHLVLAALCFYANGFLHNEIADTIGNSHVFLNTAVETVSKVLSTMLDEFITFPSSLNDRVLVAQELQKLHGIPNVVGVLGCMHIRVKPGKRERMLYMNGMGYFSIMSQMVCDSQSNLLSVETQWPGSTSEQSIWENSKICQQFKSGKHGHSLLVGANCYSLSKHVLPPLSRASNPASVHYDESHFKIQSIIQKTFGALKMRFQCLENLGHIQKDVSHKTAEVIHACCVLHNIAKKFSVPLPGEPGPEPLHHGISREEINQMFTCSSLGRT
nr:putative nuclease HARBI1 isoform X1 [Paramormyrops kingsleyae]